MQVWVHDRPARRRASSATFASAPPSRAKPAGTDELPGRLVPVYPRGFVCVGRGKPARRRAAPLVRGQYPARPLADALPLRLRARGRAAVRQGPGARRSRRPASSGSTSTWPGGRRTALVQRRDPWRQRHPPRCHGVAIDGAALPAGVKPSTQLSAGELFGGASDADPIPVRLVRVARSPTSAV